ncbi:MAG: thioesterase [Acidimicrobiia bacterium]|nr:MAG: thioesterase [Acidimicrobiia bacterium]
MVTLRSIEPFTTDTELSGQASLTVAQADTAIEYGSGDVPVLATPRLVALFEQAAVAALVGKFADDMTSVGASISIDHLAPSAIGATVTASAVLEATDGAALEFALEAVQDDAVVAEGSHTRIIVEREGFLARLD